MWQASFDALMEAQARGEPVTRRAALLKALLRCEVEQDALEYAERLQELRTRFKSMLALRALLLDLGDHAPDSGVCPCRACASAEDINAERQRLESMGVDFGEGALSRPHSN